MASTIGTPVKHLSSAERFRTSGMPLFVRRWRRHQASELHSHESSELVIVLGGRALHRDAQCGHQVRAGDVFIIHPPVVHGYAEVDGLDLVNVVFDRAHFSAGLQELQSLAGYRVLMDLEPRSRRDRGLTPALTLPGSELATIEAVVTMLQRELDSRQGGYRTLATSHFQHLLIALARAYESRPSAAGNRLLRIAELVRRIDEHPEQRHTVQGMASACGLSRVALIRAFSNALGATPIDYVIRQRIRRAAALLESSEHSVMEIAFVVGFMDSNYFSRQFRRIMGTSPRRYRAPLGSRPPP